MMKVSEVLVKAKSEKVIMPGFVTYVDLDVKVAGTQTFLSFNPTDRLAAQSPMVPLRFNKETSSILFLSCAKAAVTIKAGQDIGTISIIEDSEVAGKADSFPTENVASSSIISIESNQPVKKTKTPKVAQTLAAEPTTTLHI